MKAASKSRAGRKRPAVKAATATSPQVGAVAAPLLKRVRITTSVDPQKGTEGTAAPASSAPAAGWAEAQSFKPGNHTEVEKPVEEPAGFRFSKPGLPNWLAFDEETLLFCMVAAVADGLCLLGMRVMPKLQTAYAVAEFADLLWTAQAYLESIGGKYFVLNLRDDLGRSIKPEIMESERSRLVQFFSTVLCKRSPEITRYALPHAGPQLAAQLSEALALAEEFLGFLGEQRARANDERIESNATPLQQQAWEARARAWLSQDAWIYGKVEPGRRDPSANAMPGSEKPEVAA